MIITKHSHLIKSFHRYFWIFTYLDSLRSLTIFIRMINNFFRKHWNIFRLLYTNMYEASIKQAVSWKEKISLKSFQKYHDYSNRLQIIAPISVISQTMLRKLDKLAPHASSRSKHISYPSYSTNPSDYLRSRLPGEYRRGHGAIIE